MASFAVDDPAASCAPTRPRLAAGGRQRRRAGRRGRARPPRRPAGRLLLGVLRRPTPRASTAIYGDGADLVVTDTNRKRAERWGTIREQTGYTERAGEVAPYDPTDQRLEVFPGEATADQTVTEQRGGATVTATDYGNPVTYTPDDRPANAIDGDPQSAWRVGALADPTGERLNIDLRQPVTTDHIRLLQPINLVRNRWHHPGPAALRRQGAGDGRRSTTASRAQPGQTVHFPSRTFPHLEIEVVDTNIPKRPEYDGVSGVGFAEVGIPGVRPSTSWSGRPTDLLEPGRRLVARPPPDRAVHPAAVEPGRAGAPRRGGAHEAADRAARRPAPSRWRARPACRTTSPTRPSTRCWASPTPPHGGITADSSGHLPGSIDQRASAALDGDPSTFWSGVFNQADGPGCSTTSATRSPSTTSTCSSWPTAATRCPPSSPSTPTATPSQAVKVDRPAVADQTRRQRHRVGAGRPARAVTGQVAARSRSPGPGWSRRRTGTRTPTSRRRWPSPSWASPVSAWRRAGGHLRQRLPLRPGDRRRPPGAGAGDGLHRPTPWPARR